MATPLGGVVALSFLPTGLVVKLLLWRGVVFFLLLSMGVTL